MKLEAICAAKLNRAGVAHKEYLVRVSQTELNALGGGHKQPGDEFFPTVMLDDLGRVWDGLRALHKDMCSALLPQDLEKTN